MFVCWFVFTIWTYVLKYSVALDYLVHFHQSPLPNCYNWQSSNVHKDIVNDYIFTYNKLCESLSVLVYLLQYVYVLAVFSPKQTLKKQARKTKPTAKHKSMRWFAWQKGHLQFCLIIFADNKFGEQRARVLQSTFTVPPDLSSNSQSKQWHEGEAWLLRKRRKARQPYATCVVRYDGCSGLFFHAIRSCRQFVHWGNSLLN